MHAELTFNWQIVLRCAWLWGRGSGLLTLQLFRENIAEERPDYRHAPQVLKLSGDQWHRLIQTERKMKQKKQKRGKVNLMTSLLLVQTKKLHNKRFLRTLKG